MHRSSNTKISGKVRYYLDDQTKLMMAEIEKAGKQVGEISDEEAKEALGGYDD